MDFKLGRKAIKTDTRTLMLAKYLTPELPPPPPTVNWTKGVTNFGMMLNDTLGCCTIAGCGHAIQVWVNNAFEETDCTIPDSVILSAYESWDGYDPSDPSTDQGGIELDVLNNWRKHGLGGHHILAFVDPEVANLTELRQSIAYFGGVYIGMNVPNFIMNNIPDLWDVVTNDGGIDGGHCVFVCGYDGSSFTFISWGRVFRMTVAYWRKYVDEAHTILGAGWINAAKTPSGFDLLQLQADLACIK
jgi:hypothetical protein